MRSSYGAEIIVRPDGIGVTCVHGAYYEYRPAVGASVARCRRNDHGTSCMADPQDLAAAYEAAGFPESARLV